jgi:two-component system, response regulator
MPEDVDILLVDDNPADVELTVRALRERHPSQRVHVAEDGEQALAFVFAAPHPPKVVFLDLKMPKVDGIEVLRAIRGDGRTRVLPVVILTSSKEERDLVESYRLGVNAYIQKPLDFDEFRNAIERLGAFWLQMNQPPPRAAFSVPA